VTRLSDVAQRIGGSLHGDDASFARVISDTRQLRRGDLFVALSGERFDGHDFLRRALQLGAVGALVSRLQDGVPGQVLAPDDTLSALQRYAASWRRDFIVPAVGVAGSNGKTTTRHLLATVLEAQGPVLATQGNLNNHIGVPLTLLGLRAEHRSAVIEMGANHIGEIAPLAALAAPTVGVITASGEDHLEGFGSVEASARTNGELFAALPADGSAVINADDACAELWRKQAAHCRRLTFGFSKDADIRARTVTLARDGSTFDLVTPRGQIKVSLLLPGRHNVSNALAAAAVGVELGVPLDMIGARLATARPVSGRGGWCETADGVRVLDDTYNANPASLRAALDLLAQQPAPRIAVLGDMGELGASASRLHEVCGDYARRVGVDTLFGLGPLSAHTVAGFGRGAHHFDALEPLLAALQQALTPGAVVLVKGSRSARMERVVAALCGTTAEVAH